MLGQPSRRPILSRRPSFGPDVRTLRESFTRSIAKQQLEDAYRLASQLEAIEPGDPRWPHKRGDLLRNFGKRLEAAAAYRRAARLYERQNLSARSKALRTLARSIAGATVPVTSDVELHGMVIS